MYCGVCGHILQDLNVPWTETTSLFTPDNQVWVGKFTEANLFEGLNDKNEEIFKHVTISNKQNKFQTKGVATHERCYRYLKSSGYNLMYSMFPDTKLISHFKFSVIYPPDPSRMDPFYDDNKKKEIFSIIKQFKISLYFDIPYSDASFYPDGTLRIGKKGLKLFRAHHKRWIETGFYTYNIKGCKYKFKQIGESSRDFILDGDKVYSRFEASSDIFRKLL